MKSIKERMNRIVNIDVKQAVSRSLQFVKEMFEEKEIANLLLEEVELTEDDAYWNVTVSWIRPKPPKEVMDYYAPKEYERVYRTLKVRTDNGYVLSMKNAN